MFKQHYGAMYMCDQCMACRPSARSPKDLTYMDFADDAIHLLTQVSHEHYMEFTRAVSAFAMIPGWRLERNLFDFMHNTSLGTDRDFAPSMIFDLEKLGSLNYLGGTTQERLRGLWLELKLACKK